MISPHSPKFIPQAAELFTAKQSAIQGWLSRVRNGLNDLAIRNSTASGSKRTAVASFLNKATSSHFSVGPPNVTSPDKITLVGLLLSPKASNQREGVLKQGSLNIQGSRFSPDDISLIKAPSEKQGQAANYSQADIYGTISPPWNGFDNFALNISPSRSQPFKLELTGPDMAGTIKIEFGNRSPQFLKWYQRLMGRVNTKAVLQASHLQKAILDSVPPNTNPS